MRKKIGIIGFGPFGQFILQHLSPYFNIRVTSKTKRIELAEKMGGEFVDLPTLVNSTDIIIISVAIPVIPQILEEVKKYIRPGTLVIDVASVKIYPTNVMRKLLPKDVKILGTHPLFGPQSGKNGIEGLKIVLTPVEIEEKTLYHIEDFLKNTLKLKVFTMSPEEHDKAMSRTQVITQFIARILKDLKVSEEKLSLPSYELLLKLYNMLGEDSDILFESIQLYNPYAGPIRTKLKDICLDLWEKLKEKEDVYKKFS